VTAEVIRSLVLAILDRRILTGRGDDELRVVVSRFRRGA
jgi:hypothetical protein